jgi:dTDP-4-amino-4,6-dideoxygalactose transaminase
VFKDYLKQILKVHKYHSEDGVKKLENQVLKLYNYNLETRRVFLTENGRSALYLLFKSLNLNEDDEVLVQGYTCHAVANPIIWANAKPVYIDIDPTTLSADLEDLKKKITPKSKVVFVQHSYGEPGPIDEIIKIAKESNLIVVEDCAQCTGYDYNNERLGLKGDVLLFSFGIEKVIPTRVGGGILFNNEVLIKSFEAIFDKTPKLSRFRTFKWLINPIIWRFLRPFGVQTSIKMGTVLRRIGLIDLGFNENELLGKLPKHYPRRLTNPLAEIISPYISSSSLEPNLEHRKTITKVYQDTLDKLSPSNVEKIFILDQPYQRYPILFETKEQRDKAFNGLESRGYYVTHWYVISSRPEYYDVLQYEGKECPLTEDVESRIMIFPTTESISTTLAEEMITKAINFSRQ